MKTEELELARHNVGSIDLSDIEKLKDVEISEDELRMRAADAEIFYKKHFEKLIKLFTQKQLEFIAEEATDEQKLQFGRGTINGFALIKEWFEEQTKLSLSRFEEEEPEETGEIKPI